MTIVSFALHLRIFGRAALRRGRILLALAAMAALPASAIDLDDLLNPDAAILRQKPKPAEQAKPAEAKPAEAKPVEQPKPAVQPKPAEVKPAEVKPAEPQKPVEVKPAPQPVAQPKPTVQTAEVKEAQRKLEEERAERERQKAELQRVQDELRRQREELEAKLKSAEAARAEAEKKAAEADAARQKSEAEIGDVAKKALAERQAREQAEAGRRAAEQRAENERRAAEKAVAEKDAAVKKAAEARDAAERKSAEEAAAKEAAAKGVSKKGEKKKSATGREAVITAERTDYDRKEGVILFDRNVYVDDEQYQMHADRLFVFLDGTNDLKRLVAIGHVAITNEEKTAYCARATYSKATGKIVMYSNDEIKARLYEGGKKGSTVVGDRITFWVNSEQVEVDNPVISMPGGAMKGGNGKDFLKGGFMGGGKTDADAKKKDAANGGDTKDDAAKNTDAPKAAEAKGGEA